MDSVDGLGRADYDHWTVVLDQILDNIADGTLGGEAYVITLENGGLLIEYNTDYDIPAEAQSAGDAAVEGIKDGSITVDVGG